MSEHKVESSEGTGGMVDAAGSSDWVIGKGKVRGLIADAAGG